MTDDAHDRAMLRRAVYGLLILSTLVHVSARILTAQSRDRHTPFFSANDRSRWSTISALVDERTYSIDQVRLRPGWKSIDMVRHRGDDGQLHFYSSKPPLMATLLAPLYAVIRAVTGLSFAEHPFAVARTMLVLVNLLPLAGCLLLLAWWVERNGETDFGRIFVVACACWATFLTPFANTLNNHLPAAIFVLLSSMCLWRILYSEHPSPWWSVCGGLTAALAAAHELPALAFLAAIGVAWLWLLPRQTLLWFVPAVAVVAAGFFITNDVSHDSWRPPYAHRGDGENWYDYPGSYWIDGRQGVDRGEPSRLRYLVHILVGHHGFFALTPVWCLSVVGIVQWTARGDSRQRYFALLTLSLFAVCVVFYVALRPLEDRNYGGVASGFRWLFWLIPLWLLVMVPAADWIEERRGAKIVGFLLLAISMLSATLPAANPWSHPWLYQCVLTWSTLR
jgi:hypothetical protein